MLSFSSYCLRTCRFRLCFLECWGNIFLLDFSPHCFGSGEIPCWCVYWAGETRGNRVWSLPLSLWGKGRLRPSTAPQIQHASALSERTGEFMPSSLCCGHVNVRKWRVLGGQQPSFRAALFQVSRLDFIKGLVFVHLQSFFWGCS